MVLLGSTGSIGVNTLELVRKFDLEVEALVAGENIELLNSQIEEFQPKYVSVKECADVPKVKHNSVFCGQDGIIETIRRCKSDLVINALVGFAGLAPSVETQRLGKRLALANKESLVVAGNLLNTPEIIPIDSEHFGLRYLLNDKKVSSMVITASGGSFRDTPLERLSSMSVAEALAHPNWSMGRKITIDSATMTNKIFELLEAKWLYGCENLDAIIETKSIIHAFVNFIDGSTTAHFANADMKLPIAFALRGEVDEKILPHVDLLGVGNLEFKKIEEQRYPMWEIKEDILKNPQLGVVLNAANEVSVARFLNAKIDILEIAKINMRAYRYFDDVKPKNLDDIFEIDQEVRKFLLLEGDL